MRGEIYSHETEETEPKLFDSFKVKFLSDPGQFKSWAGEEGDLSLDTGQILW